MALFHKHLVATEWEGRSKDDIPSERNLRRRLNIDGTKITTAKHDIPEKVKMASCGHICHPTLLEHLQKHFPTGGDENLCHNCMSYELTNALEKEKTMALQTIMDCGNRTRDVYWPDAGVDVALQNGVNTKSLVVIHGAGANEFLEIPPKLRRCVDFNAFCATKQRFRVISLNSPTVDNCRRPNDSSSLFGCAMVW